MPIILDRSICYDLNETISREWLITNGLGGYAAGTVAGVLTRTQHGLLVTIPPGAVTPHLLLAKIDEEVFFDQRTYYLGTNEYRDGTFKPAGYLHLETFRLEDGIPVFIYHLGGINGMILKKRIWMLPGENTTYIQYQVINTTSTRQQGYQNSSVNEESIEAAQNALEITLLPFTAYRPYDQLQSSVAYQSWQVQIHRPEDAYHLTPWQNSLPGPVGCTLQAGQQAHPYHIVAISHPGSHVTFIPTGVWYWNFLRRHDAAAGLPATDDLYLPGVIRATLWAGTTLTILASSEPLATLARHQDQVERSYTEYIEHSHYLFQNTPQPRLYQENDQLSGRRLHHHQRILPFTTTSDPHKGGEEYLQYLFRGSEHFLLRYPVSHQEQQDILQNTCDNNTCVLRSDYYKMENKTRDALIALPGLTLVTGRYDDARNLLYELARHFKSGLLPDHLPLPGHPTQDDDYNNVDTTLWYLYALNHYLQYTQHFEFLDELYSKLSQAIDAYIQGTLNGIRLDLNDGLLYAYQPGKALTWMNATVNGLPITERGGKSVEINALWYHALSLLGEWCRNGNRDTMKRSAYYQELRELCKRSFQERFWYEQGGYLYDVVDGPTGDDPTLRPNQLLALSLRYPILDITHRHSVYEAITQHLLTPYGLRTLAPFEKGYQGKLSRNLHDHMCALHQGSVIPWLLGPYIDAVLILQDQAAKPALHQDESLFLEYLWRKGLRLLESFKEHLYEGLLGMCAGELDGDAPHSAESHAASAMSTGELLRIYDILTRLRTPHPEHALTR